MTIQLSNHIYFIINFIILFFFMARNLRLMAQGKSKRAQNYALKIFFSGQFQITYFIVQFPRLLQKF